MKIFQNKSFAQVIVAIIIIHLSIIGITYFGNHSFVFWGDQLQECIQLYANFYNDFKNGTLSLWDYSVGLGASSNVYQFTVGTAFSSFLFLLLPKVSYIPYFFPIVNLIRSLLLAFLAWYYFYQLHSKITRGGIVGTLLIAFNSFVLFFTSFPYFSDFLVYTLLLMIGAEFVLKNKNPILFIIACTLSSIANIYCIYMNCWFMLIYFTVRLFMINEKLTLQLYFKNFIRVFLYLLIGLGLSAFILIPNINSVLINNRLGGGQFHLIVNPIDIYGRFSQLISPISSDFDYNMYLNSFSSGMRTPIPYFFVSILFIYTLFVSFKLHFKHKKILLTTLTIVFVSSFFPIFNYIFNGSNDIRWAYFFTVLATIFISYVLNETIDTKTNFFASLSTSIYILIIFIISFIFNLHSTHHSINSIANTAILILIIFAYSLAYSKAKYNLCLLIICIEALYSFSVRYITLDGFETESKDAYLTEMYAINENTGLNYVRNLEKNSSQYYRIDVQKNDFTNYNDALMHNYSGFNSYLSVTNFYVNDYINRHFSSDHFINTDGTKTLAKQIAGMRYVINYGNEVIGDDLVLLKSDGFNAYHIDNAINLGFAVTQSLNSEFTHQLPSFYQDYLSQYYVITNDSTNTQIDSIHTLNGNTITIDNNYISFDDSKTKYVVIDYSLTNPLSNVTLEFYDDQGDSIEYRQISEYSYTVQPVPENASGAYVYCTNQNNANEYINTHYYLLEEYSLDKQAIVAEFSNNKIKEDCIEATINLPTDTFIHTIVAFDPNWKVYDNGNLIDTFKSNDGFVGFKLNKGSHKIMIKYQPNYILPTLITGLSGIAIAFVCYKYKKTA